jgi:hypothetical protein
MLSLHDFFEELCSIGVGALVVITVGGTTTGALLGEE